MVGAWSDLEIVLFVRHAERRPRNRLRRRCSRRRRKISRSIGPGTAAEPQQTKGCAVAAERSGKAATDYPSYLRTAEVADLLHVSPKTVSRWAKEGRLPFLKTLGGHRRFPEAEIRELAAELREEAIT